MVCWRLESSLGARCQAGAKEDCPTGSRRLLQPGYIRTRIPFVSGSVFAPPGGLGQLHCSSSNPRLSVLPGPSQIVDIWVHEPLSFREYVKVCKNDSFSINCFLRALLFTKYMGRGFRGFVNSYIYCIVEVEAPSPIYIYIYMCILIGKEYVHTLYTYGAASSIQ